MKKDIYTFLVRENLLTICCEGIKKTNTKILHSYLELGMINKSLFLE